ncbi:MAG: protein jag [Anaerolineae bacterium]|nr:protein jag [Anaerolineae bacterium]
MSFEKTTLEMIAPTVDEAISRGLNQLGLPREAIDIEVLDAGNKGLFGLGGRQARVRLTIRNEEDELDDLPVSAPVKSAPAGENKKAAVADEESILEVSKSVVTGLLEKMKVHAQVTAKYVQPDSDEQQPTVMIEIKGDDLSYLIGRRSETLNALQYITGLIVGKEVGHWVHLLIDVQGYRSRRERQLRQLATRLADQVARTGRRQTLEPMPANERRIIHLELRDHPQVTTESSGEEPNRKVTIILKK